ncbi:MAG: SpaA isopeptide-forming pilin-related protein, partial [Acutalibacteraceae bacterium]
ISDDDYNNLETKPSKTVEVNNEIWYLVEIKTTDENGEIQFSDISGEKCCIIETKAPDNYYIDTTAHICYNTDTSQMMNITNKQVINLPDVGNTGRIIFLIVGVCLITLSAVLFYKNRFAIINRLKK